MRRASSCSAVGGRIARKHFTGRVMGISCCTSGCIIANFIGPGRNKELPLLEEYYAWLNTVRPEKGSKLEEAVRYSLNQKQQLMAFLDNGKVPIPNNLAENAIHPFTLGRKNWLFCDTPKGAEASAIVYSLVESAKANGIEPFRYLQHVLLQLPYFGESHSHQELESLMPWAPYIQHNFKMSNSNAYTNTYLD